MTTSTATKTKAPPNSATRAPGGPVMVGGDSLEAIGVFHILYSVQLEYNLNPITPKT